MVLGGGGGWLWLAAVGGCGGNSNVIPTKVMFGLGCLRILLHDQDIPLLEGKLRLGGMNISLKFN